LNNFQISKYPNLKFQTEKIFSKKIAKISKTVKPEKSSYSKNVPKKSSNLRIVQIPKRFKFKKNQIQKSSKFQKFRKNRSAKPETGGKKPAKL
jgi:hypothetical protein